MKKTCALIALIVLTITSHYSDSPKMKLQSSYKEYFLWKYKNLDQPSRWKLA